jgi:hypothetical protein
MYGLTPGVFRFRDDTLDAFEVYETIEGAWLAAFYEYHAERVDRDGIILDVTKGGLSTGHLFMSESMADRRDRYRRWDESSLFDKAALDLCRTIDAEILRDLVNHVLQERRSNAGDPAHNKIIETTAIPMGMLSSFDRTTPDGLLAHEQMLRTFNAPGPQAARLRGLGLIL